MDIELAKKLVEVLEDSGVEAEIYENYSGRFMYGITTTGIVTGSISSVFEVVINNAPEFVSEDGYNPKYDVGSIRLDSMGLDIIIY